MSAIERAWRAHGIDCLVVATDRGHRCGYVRVPEGNRFYEIDYGGKVPNVLPNVEREVGSSFGASIALLGGKGAVDEYVTTLDGIIKVHGGLTFSKRADWSHLGEPRPGWWIGFDCAHAWDKRDFSIMSERYAEFERKFPHDGPESVLWTHDMVVTETERLAQQVAEQRGAYEAEQTD